MAQDWNLRSRAHVCSICQKPLEDNSAVVSVLKETGGVYERQDCHPECWKATPRDWEPFSQWDGVYFAPVKEEKKEPLKKEDAGELLRQLVTLDERDTKELEDGTIRRVYEDRKQGDTFVILDPRLRLENLAEVQSQVVALLSGTKTLGEVAKEEDCAAEPQQ